MKRAIITCFVSLEVSFFEHACSAIKGNLMPVLVLNFINSFYTVLAELTPYVINNHSHIYSHLYIQGNAIYIFKEMSFIYSRKCHLYIQGND